MMKNYKKEIAKFLCGAEAFHSFKRDLSELVRLGLLRHVGAKRNGYYSL